MPSSDSFIKRLLWDIPHNSVFVGVGWSAHCCRQHAQDGGRFSLARLESQNEQLVPGYRVGSAVDHFANRRRTMHHVHFTGTVDNSVASLHGRTSRFDWLYISLSGGKRQTVHANPLFDLVNFASLQLRMSMSRMSVVASSLPVSCWTQLLGESFIYNTPLVYQYL